MILPELVADERRAVLARLIGNGIAQALLAVATLVLTRVMFDRVIGDASVAAGDSGLMWLGAAMAAVVGVAIGLVTLERIDAEKLGQSYARCVRVALFEHLTELSPRALQKHSRGSIVLRFVGDLSALRQWLSQGLARLAVTGAVISATLVALGAMNGLIAAVVLTVLIGGIASSVAASGPLSQAIVQARRRSARLAANVNEKVASMPVVQVHHQTRRERRLLERQSRKLEAAMVARARWIGVLRAIGDATGRIATAAVLLVGALEVRNGGATPGIIVAAATVVGFLSPSIRDLGRVFEMWNKARVARTKLETFLTLPYVPRVAQGFERLAAGPGQLDIDAISFSPIAEFSAMVPAHSRVAIVGPNGAGKSTLIWLAARLMDPDSGRILIDGQDLKRLTVGSLRRAIGIVSPGLPLLRGTVRSNLTYRWSRASDDDIERACASSGLDDLLADLPHGLDTKLADQGANLSEGQRQRIALARALLGEPRVLLLDELEANLDQRTRAAVGRALRNYPGTVLMVTHEPSWLRNADIVWHLRDGKLVEAGDPTQLLEANGPTAKMFRRFKAVS